MKPVFRCLDSSVSPAVFVSLDILGSDYDAKVKERRDNIQNTVPK